ncbi:MAG: hypothetical protein VXZ96_13310 [Myxococcota bacterium]|nr:hypothetical protein [Myxococcota bacterium]
MTRNRLFQFLSIFFGIGILCAIELLLRVNGTFAHTVLSPTLPSDWKISGIPAAGQPQSTMLVRDGNTIHLSQMAKSHMKTPSFELEPETRRIFTFGGSATLGVPVEDQPEQTFPGQLSALLAQVGVPNETLYLGGASFGSDHVNVLANEVKSLSPSALLIYSGNNEYFNFGLALSQENPRYQTGKIYVQSLHTVRLLNHLFGRGPTQLTISYEQIKFEQDIKLAELIQGVLYNEPNSIIWEDGLAVRNDSITQTVANRFKNNLRSVLDAYPGQTVIIGEVPPNLFEPPWLSLHHPDTSQSTQSAFTERTSSIQFLPCEDAIHEWEKLIQMDAWRADAWYGLGVCQHELGLEYETSLRNALELDMNPGRPTAALNAVLTELDGADVIRFSAFEDTNDFGRSLFHDSCHLTPEGYGTVAKDFRNALIAQGWAF